MPICMASACGSCSRLPVDSLCMPWTERIWVSRMREICTSGLKRAGAVKRSAPPLLDYRDFRMPVLSQHSKKYVHARNLSWMHSVSRQTLQIIEARFNTVAIHYKPQFQLRIDVTSPHETVKFTSLLVDLLLVMIVDHGADHSGTNNALLSPCRDRAAGPRQSR